MMASIKRINGKNKVSFLITVSSGRDSSGKQQRHYLTWSPDKPMSEKQLKKAVEKAAFEFEQSLAVGYQIDKKLTFSEYADYVLEIKAKSGAKSRTIERYRELLVRICAAIGSIKLSDIRPSHLNSFYLNLAEDGVAFTSYKALAKTDISELLVSSGISKSKASQLSGLATSTIRAICRRELVNYESAEKLARALNCNMQDIFESIPPAKSTLSPKTIAEHHRLIHTILAQATKEMLVPYNAADKATLPKVSRPEPNYFQPNDIVNILHALDNEPIKWRTITHLLIITGCRRGEIMGLKWDKVDFENNRLRIDSTLLYSPKRGIYEDTPKTNSSVRYVNLPQESMSLLSEYLSWYNDLKQKNGDRWIDTGFCFVKDNGEPMMPDSITSWLRKFSDRYGLPHINPHAFRHTMATILINSGKDIVSVSKRLGHSKTSTTTDIYAHIIDEADEQSGEILADVLLKN